MKRGLFSINPVFLLAAAGTVLWVGAAAAAAPLSLLAADNSVSQFTAIASDQALIDDPAVEAAALSRELCRQVVSYSSGVGVGAWMSAQKSSCFPIATSLQRSPPVRRMPLRPGPTV